MTRTTIDIDEPILSEVRALQRKDRRPLGRLVSELLAEALADRRKPTEEPQLRWISRPMHALIDLADKETLYAILDDHDTIPRTK